MKLLAALSILLTMAMVMAVPEYGGYGGAYPSSGPYQSYSGGIGWLPGFFGGSGYHSGSFHTNVAGVHSADGGGVSIASRSSPGGFNTNASGNGGVNVTGMSSSWSYFPGLNGQSTSNIIHTTLSNRGDSVAGSNTTRLVTPSKEQQQQPQLQQQSLPFNTVGGQQQQLEQQQQQPQLSGQQQFIPGHFEGGFNAQFPPTPTKLNSNDIATAKATMLAYRENSANLLHQADQIEQLLLQIEKSDK